MNEISFTPFPVLATERLILRKITHEDLDEFFILKSDERLLKSYYAKAKTYEQAGESLDKLDEGISRNEWIYWGITLKDDNKIIGSICLWNISKEESKAEIGYELMFDRQGKGIMSEAVNAVIRYGFDSMKLDVIEAVPYSDNIKSNKLLERMGFTRLDSFKEEDCPVEMVIYGLRNKKLSYPS